MLSSGFVTRIDHHGSREEGVPPDRAAAPAPLPVPDRIAASVPGMGSSVSLFWTKNITSVAYLTRHILLKQYMIQNIEEDEPTSGSRRPVAEAAQAVRVHAFDGEAEEVREHIFAQ